MKLAVDSSVERKKKMSHSKKTPSNPTQPLFPSSFGGFPRLNPLLLRFAISAPSPAAGEHPAAPTVYWTNYFYMRDLDMALRSYGYQAELLVKNYLLHDSFIPFTSLLGGIFLCKMAYDFTQFISSFYFKAYISLTKIQRMDWNNRGMSSIHAIFITVMSFYLIIFTNLFTDNSINVPVTFRSSYLSTFALGVSVGYFLADLSMILWLYPSLGGMEYVFHHTISAIAVSYTMLSGEGQFYTYLVLISEITTPGINLRWFLDTAGMKRSKAYLVNGVMVFFSWMAARILLFIYLFYHVYLHYNQVMQMHTFGYLLVFVVPSALGVMNLMWFGKILKGVRKTLSKGR